MVHICTVDVQNGVAIQQHRHSAKAGLMLVHRLRLSTNIKPTFTKQHTFDGKMHNTSCRPATIPANTKYLYSVYTMLSQRRRRWTDVVSMLYKCFVFAGMTHTLIQSWLNFGPCLRHWPNFSSEFLMSWFQHVFLTKLINAGPALLTVDQH